MVMSTQNGQILTVNPMGVFIDETPTLKYNGEYLAGLGHFDMGLVDGILEIQVMQSDVSGRYGNAVFPLSASGKQTWCLVSEITHIECIKELSLR